jgi:hypothetical protein
MKKQREIKEKHYKLERGITVTPLGEEMTLTMVEAVDCERCNGNGCPACDKSIRWNIKD